MSLKVGPSIKGAAVSWLCCSNYVTGEVCSKKVVVVLRLWRAYALRSFFASLASCSEYFCAFMECSCACLDNS